MSSNENSNENSFLSVPNEPEQEQSFEWFNWWWCPCF